MTGRDLKHMCDGRGKDGCDGCPASKKCQKWKEDRKKLSEMEPWQLDEFQDLANDMVYYKTY